MALRSALDEARDRLAQLQGRLEPTVLGRIAAPTANLMRNTYDFGTTLGTAATAPFTYRQNEQQQKLALDLMRRKQYQQAANLFGSNAKSYGQLGQFTPGRIAKGAASTLGLGLTLSQPFQGPTHAANAYSGQLVQAPINVLPYARFALGAAGLGAGVSTIGTAVGSAMQGKAPSLQQLGGAAKEGAIAGAGRSLPLFGGLQATGKVIGAQFGPRSLALQKSISQVPGIGNYSQLIVRRVIPSLLNVLEGIGLDPLMGSNTTKESIASDAVVGLIFGPGSILPDAVKELAPYAPESAIVKATKQLNKIKDSIDEGGYVRLGIDNSPNAKAISEVVNQSKMQLDFLSKSNPELKGASTAIESIDISEAKTPSEAVDMILQKLPDQFRNDPNVITTLSRWKSSGNQILMQARKSQENLYKLDKGIAESNVTKPPISDLSTQRPSEAGTINFGAPVGGQEQPNKYSDEVNNYLKELQDKQQSARGESSSLPKMQGFLNEVKRKFVDQFSPIEDALSSAEKKYGYTVLPKQDFSLQVDRVIRARTLGAQYVEDSGLADVIRNVDDVNEFDQYLIAKRALEVSQKGIETGRNLELDKQLVTELAPKYSEYELPVRLFNQGLLQYAADTGLISKELQANLIKQYPSYVPLNRIFSDSELEAQSFRSIGSAPASVSSQTVVQKLKGSDREIESPLAMMITKAQTAFEQGERNRAATMLVSYKDMPGFEDLIKEVDHPTGRNTVSYFQDGVKKTVETTPEIASAAKNLDVETLGVVLKVLRYPTRVLQLGATSLNLPFVVTNVEKDQLTSFINSKYAAKTSLANPMNFGKALYSAVAHDDLYDEMVRNAGGGTYYDIARSAPLESVERIRAGRSASDWNSYVARHPEELLRQVEDIIGRGEELTRIQQYKGAYDALIEQGRTIEDARLLAAEQARSNTANFARKGEWGRVLNAMIPYFNAGIQGARVLVRSAQRDIVGTGAKLSLAVFMPIAISTIWNLGDEKRKQAYKDIKDYEKENNLIILPPGELLQDDRGRYNVIKIPITPGISNLGTIVRRIVETTQGLDPVKFQEIFANLFTAGTSIDITSPNRFINSFLPQGMRTPIEYTTNTNLYTGNKIVPEYMKNRLPEDQAFPNTSGTARIIAKPLRVSPLQVENAFRTGGAGVGSQLLNASDALLANTGVIPKQQISGENIFQNIQRRFSKASGGSITDTYYELKTKNAAERYAVKDRVTRAINGESVQFNDIPLKNRAIGFYQVLENTPASDRKEIYKQMQPYITPDVRNELNSIIQLSRLGFASSDFDVVLAPKDIRARAIIERLNDLTKPENRRAKYNLYERTGIITPQIKEEMTRILKEEELKKQSEGKKNNPLGFSLVKPAYAAEEPQQNKNQDNYGIIHPTYKTPTLMKKALDIQQVAQEFNRNTLQPKLESVKSAIHEYRMQLDNNAKTNTQKIAETIQSIPFDVSQRMYANKPSTREKITQLQSTSQEMKLPPIKTPSNPIDLANRIKWDAVEQGKSNPGKPVPLVVKGDKVTRSDTGEQVLLRGAVSDYFRHSPYWYYGPSENITNVEHTTGVDALIKHTDEMKKNGVNTMGLYISGDQFYKQMDDLDTYVKYANDNGIYVYLMPVWRDYHKYLDLQHNLHEPKGKDMPKLMETLSKRYKDYPNVVYGFGAEPETWDWIQWKKEQEDLAKVVRKNSPNSLVLVSTLVNGSLIGDTIKNPANIDNAMYYTGAYTSRDDKETQTMKQSGELDKILNERTNSMTALKGQYPMMVGEFGGHWGSDFTSDEDIAITQKMLDTINSNNLSYSAYRLDPAFHNDTLSLFTFDMNTGETILSRRGQLYVNNLYSSPGTFIQ